MNKPGPARQRPLAEVLRKTLADAFAKQGFASIELVTHWSDIVGPEISTHSQPEKIQWARGPQDADMAEPGTLFLRVEGPTAIEIQHLSDVILQRVNQFFGWQAVGALRLRQAPLTRQRPHPQAPAPDPEAVARLAASLPEIADDRLRAALARLAAAVGGEK